MDARLARLNRMKAWRVRPERDTSITKDVNSFIKEQKRVAKSLGNVVEAFEALVPPNVAQHCTLQGLKGGVLTIEVSSSGARYELDRLVRCGLEASLRERVPGAKLARVRVLSSSAS